MAIQAHPALLTDEFLLSLYHACVKNDYVYSVAMDHIIPSYLPDKDFQELHKAFAEYHKSHRGKPDIAIIRQMLAGRTGSQELLNDVDADDSEVCVDGMLEQLERYIRQVKFQAAYKEAGDIYNKHGSEAAAQKLLEYTEWASDFGLVSGGYVNVVAGFSTRLKANHQKYTSGNSRNPVTRFYIDELDERNHGRDLRGQLTCFLASTGVGKSHIARWVGKNACQVDGLNVLHFQLEGSEDEIVDAYSASLVHCSIFDYETGAITDEELEKMEKMIAEISGTLYVKAYPKFNAHVSTIDISKGIKDFRRRYGVDPDVVIIDSMDLLTDSSGRNYSEKGERMKRIGVANDLKDLASEEKVWMVVTYQSTIESQEWFDDETKVLTAYNTAEAKGISRPLTHLISLNQSNREAKENTMRLHVAKSRNFKRGEPIKIATDYDHERFYDRVRTMNINKVS